MQKPSNYDETKVGGSFEQPALGGHKMIIKHVAETKNKNNKDMIVVCFDFDKSDIQPLFFSEEFKNDVRPEKKWPHAGTMYINVEDQSTGDCSKSFKRFITSFERSNNCEAVWGDKFAAQFKNKKIGGVFGEKENEYNGRTFMRNELFWFCDIRKAADASIPEPRMLPKEDPKKAAANDGFMKIEEGTDEDIPWG